MYNVASYFVPLRPGLILGLRPTSNERRRYKVTTSLIGWVQTWNQPCKCLLTGLGAIYRKRVSACHSCNQAGVICPTLTYDICMPVPLHISVTSQWARWRLNAASRLFTQLFDQAEIKENFKAPRHWPLWGELPGTGDFPAQRASNAENVSIWLRHYDRLSLAT